MTKNPYIDFEISFFEELIESIPNHIEALIHLAENYTAKGMYKKGLHIDMRLSRLLPQDETVHYNLACSYALINDKDNALIALKKAISLGYNDFHHMLNDPDLDCLQETTEYKELTKKYIKKIHEKYSPNRRNGIHRA